METKTAERIIGIFSCSNAEAPRMFFQGFST
jgi:hypothetical protein